MIFFCFFIEQEEQILTATSHIPVVEEPKFGGSRILEEYMPEETLLIHLRWPHILFDFAQILTIQSSEKYRGHFPDPAEGAEIGYIATRSSE